MPARILTSNTVPIVRAASLNISRSRRSVTTYASHGVPVPRHRSLSFTDSMPSSIIPCGPDAGCGSEVPRSLPSPQVVGGALVPSLSASSAANVPAPAAVLVMSATEAADDSITDVSGTLHPNASWPEAFFLLSNIIGGTLLMKR
jgi:hypothetical protein